MKSTDLVVFRPIRWSVVFLLIVILSVGVVVGNAIGGIAGIVAAGVIFVGYAQASRAIVLSGLTHGLRLTKREQYQEAIDELRHCYNFLSDHPWIDDFRAIVLLSPSEFSYRESCLCSIAYCLFRSGMVGEARRAYEEILILFPNNPLAKQSLEAITIAASAQLRGEGNR